MISVVLSSLFAPSPAQSSVSRSDYINRYKGLAIEGQLLYGIPASITMSQAILESNNGNSRLAVEANNHFGIKCRSDWNGDTIRHDDDAMQECFRRYPSVSDSYRDHSVFLQSPRYKALFSLDKLDYHGWANGLRSAGYATNPRYGEILIKVIEENRLYLLDEAALAGNIAPPPPPATAPATPAVPTVATVDDGQRRPVERPSAGRLASEHSAARVEEKFEKPARNTSDDLTAALLFPTRQEPSGAEGASMLKVMNIGGHTVYNNNGSQFIIASDGETFEKLGTLLGVTAGRLRSYNDLSEGSQPTAGTFIYIKDKASRGDQDNGPVHVVSQGETLWSISQLYGIKLRQLAGINKMETYFSLRPGQHILLR
ncbi:MAG: glucosaminidase domain-containing protein [Rikenellaceae bacterium]|nr:glucosaminidase domain-containing protein [Rikenellaceae bacterium]